MKKLFLTFFMLFALNANALIISEAEVFNAIKNQANKEDVSLEVFAGQTSFDTKEAKNHRILVSGISFDDTQNRFECKVEVFADNKLFAKSDIIGKFYNMVEIFVPKQEIEKQTLITEQMLDAIKIQENKIKDVYVTKKEDIIGKEAKKDLLKSKFIFSKDVQKPILVNKNELTMVLYKTPKMQIAMKAYALKDGAKDELIELINPSSKKTIMGKVVSKNTVIIEGEK